MAYRKLYRTHQPVIKRESEESEGPQRRCQGRLVQILALGSGVDRCGSEIDGATVFDSLGKTFVP